MSIMRRVAIHGMIGEVIAPRVPFARTLDLMLSGYAPAAPEAPVDVAVTVARDPRSRLWVVSTGDRSFRESEGHTMAARRVDWLFISEGIKRWERFIHVHAAVLATPDESVLIVGRSGAGKSTTSVALAQAGLTLFTDDVALIARDTLRPFSVPRPIKLDLQSRRLLRKTGLRVRPESRLGESIARTALPGLAPLAVPGPPLTKAIFFGEGRQAQAQLRDITRAEAVIRLVQQSASERFGESGPTDGALAVVNAVRCYELVAGDLDTTVQTVLDLIDPHGRVGSDRVVAWPVRRSALSAD